MSGRSVQWALLAILAGGALWWALRARRPQSVGPLQPLAPTSSASSPAATTASPSESPFDCEGLGPAPPSSCAAPTDAVADVVRAASFTSNGAIFCLSTERPPAGWAKLARSSLAAIAAADPKRLPTVERLVAQNASLRLWLCGRRRLPEAERPAFEALAARAVTRLALSAQALDALAPDNAASAWLGDAAGWRDLAIFEGPGPHEIGQGLTRLSRPLARDTEAANVSRLVAIDTDGQPHVTPLVSSIEIRRHPARCLASIDVGWLRCGAVGGLRPITSYDDSAAMLFRFPEATACNGCHRPGIALPKELSASEAAGQSERREKAVLKKLVGEMEAAKARMGAGR